MRLVNEVSRQRTAAPQGSASGIAGTKRHALLKASTALVGLSLLTAGIGGMLLWPSGPALANGGHGTAGAGGFWNSGMGGGDSATAAGGNGTNATGAGATTGGGGGGAGVTGGAGGSGSSGSAGGPGGPTPGASGTAGTSGGSGGGGGGGGAHGSVGSAPPGAISTGGNGGNGGNGGSGGGGGGAGGYGAVVTGSGALGSLATAVTGGNGGNGGNASSRAGNGGSGGIGLLLTDAAGASLTIDAAVQGGNGGAGGGGAIIANGSAGSGGVGLSGQNLSITLGAGGSIAGGLAGGGGGRADALQLSGSSSLSFATAGAAAITGNIAVTGALMLDLSNGVNVLIANAITGSGAVGITGPGTITLTAASSYAGGTTIDPGARLQLGNGGSIAGNVANNGTLAFNRDDTTFAGDISGTGALVQEGAGTTILTGANTYTGGTEIAFGTLQIGNGGTAGSLAGNVTNNAALAFSRSDTVTFAGDISGTGTLTQAGTGTTILTGTNTHSGGTTIAAGTLQIGDGGSTGSLAGNVTNNGTLAFNRNDILTFAGAISGTGALRQEGSGTTILTGTNSYSGGTTLAGGTLAIAADAAIGATSGALTFEGGTLRFDAFFNLATTRAISIGAAGGTIDTNGYWTIIAQGISGTGGLRVSGLGELVLTGANTYAGGTTIDAGTVLSLGQGGTTGSIAGNVTNNGTLAFNHSDTATFAGDISGSGRLLRFGIGTTVLTGDATHAGGTTIVAGTLQIGAGGTTGSLAGNVTNNGTLAFNRSDAVTFAGAISGTGALRQEGSGSTTLIGNATHTGGTTIAAGTLRIGNGGTTGSLAGNVTNNGTLAFNRSDAVTLAGAISGTGTLRQEGSGTTTLTGNATHTGGTTIAAGTLRIGNGGTTGSLAGNVVNNGTLAFNRSDAVTLAGAISGTGTLRQEGSGTTTLTGNATHTGGTTIAAGTLRIGNGGTTGSLAGNVVNNGTLAFNRSDTITFAGAISGTGAVRLEGAGTVVLAGANTFTGGLVVANGTLRISDGGSIAGTVTNDATMVFAQSGRVSFDALSGTGGLQQEGSGTTELTGTNTYTGATAVNAGTLVVNGSIATSSGVMVASGGMIGGNATLPSTTIASGATISPGNSPGTITVRGNLTLDAGSLYIAEVQGAVADRINVTGTASLAGTVRLVPLGGTYSFSSPYTLLSAHGGRSGTFTTVDTAGSFGDGVTSAVTYTATDVLLTLTPKPLTPIIDTPIVENPSTGPRLGLGTPANLHAVAAGIDRAVAAGADPSGLFAIYNLPAAAIPAAVNQLSGEVHTAVPAMAVSAADQFLLAMLDPRAAGRILGTAGPGLANKAAHASRYAVWASVFGSTGHSDGSARQGSARRDLDDAHVAVGADLRLDAGTVAGFALAFGSARSSLAGGLGKAEADVFQAGLYGMTRLGPVSIGAALGYARVENDVSRAVPVLGGALSADYATDAWSGRLQAGAAVFEQGGFTLSPMLALQATRVSSPAVHEAGRGAAGGAALTLAGRDDVTSRGELGLQLDYAGLFGETALTGHLRAGWGHYFQRDAGLSAAIAGLPGSGFAIEGARGSRNAALLSAGIEASITPAVTVSARFDSEIAGSAARYGGTAQIRYSF